MNDPVPVPESDTRKHPTTTVPEPRAGAVGVVTTKGALSMPKLGLGTWQLDPDVAADSVEHALRTGWRHIDTAQMYDNEAGVGRGIAASGVNPSDIFVTTKIANDLHEPKDLVNSMSESLGRLGLDRVDLTLVHWPVEWDRIGATLSALAQVHAAGMTRHIGVSNFTIDQLEVAKDMAPVEVLQAECHPFLRQDELRAWCVEHDWAFTAYSPLARGDVFGDDAIAEIARSHDVTEAQIALAWLMSLDKVAAIPRSSDHDHIDANFASTEVELSEDERATIEGLVDGRRLVDPDFAPW